MTREMSRDALLRDEIPLARRALPRAPRNEQAQRGMPTTAGAG
eukprot:CAMPEP_0183370786 /NCGR_PEP_ID=MMETSP0164_2-20130417/103455_1 /TAXON_ID=221442 /ORGANISM="Coccolithus pelagicus ssp braarudi, Strain PLY182g" /LENGTH=42 /DNA_ID= /DNA_START= /DNA_END= /DNA_ORIENTATION=